MTLRISNSEIAERAGFGLNFFTTVVRDQRRPKLSNFLRSLDVFIGIANERLFDVDRAEHGPDGGIQRSTTRIEQDYEGLLLLSITLGSMAREEIAQLANERPNSPEALREAEKRRELLEIFADGFDRIAQALTALKDNPKEPLLSAEAGRVVDAVGAQINAWWVQNGSEAVDWAIRLPAFMGGVAALSWAGANMMVATTAVAAMVGGEKVLEAIKRVRKKT